MGKLEKEIDTYISFFPRMHSVIIINYGCIAITPIAKNKKNEKMNIPKNEGEN